MWPVPASVSDSGSLAGSGSPSSSPASEPGGAAPRGGPLEHVVDRAVDEDQAGARVLLAVRDRLILGGELGQRRDEVERGPVGRERGGLRRERLQRDREAAVLEPRERDPEVLAALHEDHLRRALAEATQHVQRRRRRVVLDREDLERLAGRSLDVVEHRPQQRAEVRRVARERGRGRLQLATQGRQRRVAQRTIKGGAQVDSHVGHRGLLT